MTDAINWVFRVPSATITWMMFVFLVAAWFFKALNHREGTHKERVSIRIRDTVVLILLGVLTSGFYAEALEYINGDLDRSGRPILVRLTFWLPVIAGDWFDLLIYEMANHEGGWTGWLREHPKLGALWLIDKIRRGVAGGWRKIKSIRYPWVTLALVAIALLLIGCDYPVPGYTPSAPQMTAGALSATYQVEATQTWASKATGSPLSPDTTLTPGGTSTLTPSPQPSPTPGPTVTPSPTMTSSIAEATRGAPTTPVPHIIEVDTKEIEWLAALCWVEVRSFGDRRPGACASVVDTVMERVRRRELSSGDVYSAITWGCDKGTQDCQFPRWVIDGCTGIVPQACPFYDAENMIYFQGIVLGYLAGNISPECPGRIYYGNQPGDMRDCIIVAPNGNREGWHN